MPNIKPIIQRDLKDCGVCSMLWIIMYYDGFVPLEKLRDDTLTDSNGTTAYHIVEAFKKWGFDSYGVLEHDLFSNKIKYPLIAHINLPNGLTHFLVIKKVVKDTIYVMDPSVGNKKYKLNEFETQFTGYIILAYPREKIINMDKGLSIGNIFTSIISKEKDLVINLIISSLILTIFIIINSYYLKIGSNLLNEDNSLLKLCIASFLIIILLKVTVSFLRNYYENHLSNKVDAWLYPEFIRHLFYLPLKSISSRSTGEILTRIEELSSIKNLFSEVFVTCVLDSITLLVSMIILYIINNKLLMVLIITLLIYIAIGVIVSKIMYKKMLSNISYQTDFNSDLVENVNMLTSIKNLNIIEISLQKIEKTLSKFLYSNYEFGRFFNLSTTLKELIIESCFFIINSYGLFLVYNGNMSIIDLFTFNIVVQYALEPVKNIINLLPKYNYIKVSFSKLSEFISMEEESSKNDLLYLHDDIIFRNVSYSFNKYDYTFQNLNLVIKKGSHVLINGASGCGKSTVCKLITKENKPSKGDIYIGAYNLKDMGINSIRENILYVSQNEEIFTATIKENIICSRDVDMELFLKVCELCQVNNIVDKKIMRYESIIGPNLNNLSGGEKQRVILARGLLKNANIIILDEALSEVDKELEKTIIQNIRRHYKEKTIIYISHRDQKDCFENIIELESLYE